MSFILSGKNGRKNGLQKKAQGQNYWRQYINCRIVADLGDGTVLKVDWFDRQCKDEYRRYKEASPEIRRYLAKPIELGRTNIKTKYYIIQEKVDIWENPSTRDVYNLLLTIE